MKKYIIVYQKCTSYYEKNYHKFYDTSPVSNTFIENYTIDAISKEEAFEKFIELTKKQKTTFLNLNINATDMSFAILNIIDLEG